MFWYLLKILLLLVFWIFVISQYYFQFNHVENFDGYIFYLPVVAIIYGIFKYLQYEKFKISHTVTYTYVQIISLFLIHLFLFCGLFFVYNWLSFWLGLTLFFKIIFYSLFPLFTIIISYFFWKSLCNQIEWFNRQNNVFKNILSIIIWFSLFIFLLAVLGFFGQYNIISLWIISIVFLIVWYKSILGFFTSFQEINTIEVHNKNPHSWYILSGEFFALIAMIIFSVTLISVLKPFPIWWDDLGVYMNYPQLYAQAWEILHLGGMYSWQVFTGIWYMFESPAQAFFLNSVWGFVSFFFLYSIFQNYFSSTKKQIQLHLPMIFATIFISMPMVVFQQAKDMKHDSGLFFLWIWVIFVLFSLLQQKDLSELKNKVFHKIWLQSLDISSKVVYFALIGFVLWFTFTLKFTALLLILSVLAVIFYARLWLFGLFWYISLFVWIFTKLGFWKYMNIVYDIENTQAINSVFWITSFVWIVFLIIGFYQNKDIISVFIQKVWALLTGLLIAIIPWMMFNASSAENITVSTLLSWKTERLEVDLSEIYTEEELIQKDEENKKYTLSATGTTWNEDWGRYFWYEEGINNFIKLPVNLSMQANQAWEFTDITYLYFVFLPLILLFLPVRNKYLFLPILAIFVLEVLLFFIPGTREFFTQLFSEITLPFGYIVLLLGFLIPFFILLYSIKDTKKSDIFKWNIVFAFVYVFLWTISAYGVVWYGIIMYFNLLLIIAYGIFYALSYRENDEENVKNAKILWTLVIWLLIIIYFIFSVFPHSFKNLKNAGYKEYKANQVATIEAQYLYATDNLKILFELNINPEKHKTFIHDMVDDTVLKYIELINQNNQETKKKGTYNIIDIYDIEELVGTMREMRKSNQLKDLHKQLSDSLDNVYTQISHPTNEYKNTKSIYRIGTFLRYYISENNKRLYEDSLITQFYSYILWGNPNQTVENMKKLWLEYFLVDLNAATIDNDPRRNLTKRYESLLRTFTSWKLELVSTDSICFQIGLEQYNKSSKTIEDYSEYITLAWVNYTSYTASGDEITRTQKLGYCYEKVISLIQEWKVDSKNYSYLLSIQNYFIKNPEVTQDIKLLSQFLQKRIKHGSKVFFKIK